MNKFIPVNTPLLSGNEKKYLLECIDTGWISSEGPFVKQFEEIVARSVDRKYGVAVSNGTAALEIAVVALGIGEGDEVIMPSHTIISCAQSIVKAGAKPVLIDSDSKTWNMDVSQIESKISSKTKAIMVVHLYGLPVEMNEVLRLAKKYNLYIIEDTAQMLGQNYKGRACGSFGDISTFSFYPNKQITTGEGGMCVTSDERLAKKCTYYRNLCFGEKRFIHEELGWNYRMTNLQAAIGVAQIEKLNYHVQRKREIGKKYQELLSDNNNFSLAIEKTEYAENIYWIVGIILNKDSSYSIDVIMKELRYLGVDTRPFFYPIHLQPIFLEMGLFKNEDYPMAEDLYNRGFYIPSGLGISNDDIEYVSRVMNNYFK
jgi:perosamine synthetase